MKPTLPVGPNFTILPYSRKIWRELNLAKSPKTAKVKNWRNLIWRLCTAKAMTQSSINNIGVLRNPRRTTCNAAEHVKFFCH